MKKIFFIIAFLAFTPLGVKGQWNLLKNFGAPEEFINDITSIYFLDLPGPPRIGFVGFGSDSNTLWKTTDGGSTWYPIPSLNKASGDGVYDFTFKDSLTGWLVLPRTSVNYGCYKTTDGGETWKPDPVSGPDRAGGFSIYYHHATDLLFISPDDGTFMSIVSTDEGATWQNLDNGFAACAFSDDSSGILVEDPMLYTTNGGKTWDTSNNSPDVGIHPLAIKGTKTFFMLGWSGRVSRSDDGGKNWTFVSEAPGKVETTLLYGDIDHMYTQTSSGVFVSTDEGISWQTLCGPSNFLGSDGRVGFYARDNYIYAPEFSGVWDYDTTRLWIDSTGSNGAAVPVSFYLKSDSIQVRGGDTVNIPVYLKGNGLNPVLDGLTVIIFPFLTDTSLLRPINFLTSIRLSLYEVGDMTFSHDTVMVSYQVSELDVSGETLVGYLQCIGYLGASVALGDVHLSSEDPRCINLTTNTDTLKIDFTGCGDSLILAAMQGAPPFSLVSIQPNPASSSIEINLRKSSPAPIDYTLFDVLGNSLLTQHSALSTQHFDVSNFPSGTYYLRLSQNGFVQTRSVEITR